MVLVKQSKDNVDRSKVEVGEIDTSSPFESVKHAISLFGAVAFTRKRTRPSGRKPEPQSFEKVSVKESKLHLAEKELNKLTENLRDAEVARSLALVELEKAKKTIKELNRELSVISKSKDAVLKETENLDNYIKIDQEKNSGNGTSSSWRQDMDTFRVQYLAAALELNAAKQELGKLRQDYDSAFRSYNSVLRQSSEAVATSKGNNEAAIELSGKISGMKELIEQATLASELAEEEKKKTEANREILGQEYKIKLDVSAKALEELNNKLDPETTKKLQKQLDSIAVQSEALKQDVHRAEDSYSEIARMIALELDIAKATLRKLIDEDSSLRRLIESLKLELENVKKELFELNKKEAETKHFELDLEAELQKRKWELETCMTEESNVRSTCDKMKATLVGLLTETQRTRQEVKDNMIETEAVMKDAEADRKLIKAYEAKLQLLLQEVEADKLAEAEALESIKLLSDRKDSGAKISLSKEEFNSLSVKIKDSATIADTIVSAAIVQVETVKAHQNDGQKMLEESQKELEEIKLATAEALEIAEEAEAGKNKLKEELVRLGQCLHTKAEGVPDCKTDYEIDMQPLSYPEGFSKSYSTSRASRRRVTLGDILKLDRKGRQPMRSLSGSFRSM